MHFTPFHIFFTILQDQSDDQYSLKPYSKRTAELIDSEVQRLVAEAFHRAVAIIQSHEGQLMRLVNTLLEKEVVSADELREIIGTKKPSPQSAAT